MLRILLALAAFLLIAASPPTISVPTNLSVKEGGVIGVPVCRPTATGLRSSFYYQTISDTAVGGTDFYTRSGNASIAKNAKCYTISLSTKQNSVYALNKQFKFQIRATFNAVVGNAETLITIVEDDPLPPPPPPPAVKPILSTAPITSGETVENKTLMTSNGVWTGALRYFYAWYRNNVQVEGRTTNSYALTAADVGQRIKSGVVACNDAGCTFSYSNEVGPITAEVVTPPPPPTCVPPQVLVNGVCTDPTTPPPTGWKAAPADGWNGLLFPTRQARAVRTCSSIYRTAETDRVGISFLGVVTGEVFNLIVIQPNGSWGLTPASNIFNQFGNIWTVYPLNQTYDEAVAAQSFRTVSQDCLEGVVPS